jgi:hypothetical protein
MRVGGSGQLLYTAEDFLVQLTPAHCRAARGWLGWTQIELSRRARVGLTAIRDFENENRRTHRSVQFQLQAAFAKAGVWCSQEGIWDENLVDLEAALSE